MAKEITFQDVDDAWQEYYQAVDHYQFQFLNGDISQSKMHSKTKAHGDRCEKLETDYLAQ